MQMTTFLKRVLFLDAASCIGMGAGLALAGASLAAPLGLPAPLLTAAGIVLIPIGLFMAFVATRAAPPALLVWLVILGNLAWVAKSVGVILLFPAITALGAAFVLAQAAWVALMAWLEHAGLRRAPAVA